MVRQSCEYVLTERAMAHGWADSGRTGKLQTISAAPDFLPFECRHRFIIAGFDYVAQHTLPTPFDGLASG